MMDDALPWRRNIAQRREEPAATARTGGDNDDGPALIARISGQVRIEMAREALEDAGIPAYIKRDTMGAVYGLTVGALAAAEVWVPRPLAEQAEDVLIGIGVLSNKE
jgi:hypothetical protein